MPELPEVETVVRILNKKVKNTTIKKVEILYPKLLKTDISIKEFKNKLTNKKIENISRIAKYIIFEFSDVVLISHLRMEGRWYVYSDKNKFLDKHVEAIFDLEDGRILVYSDTRKFGTFHLQEKNSYKHQDPINKLGLEPFDKNMDGIYLMNLLKKSNKCIKTALLDQSKIAGIGNIYANEILFECRINPQKKANQLTLQDFENIVFFSKKILKKSIQLGGSTIDSYHPEQGIDGKFQNELLVHMRANKKCFVCGSIIKKIYVNKRGTYYCELCQK